MPRLTIVISQGQSNNPAKRRLEETLVGTLLLEPGLEVTVIPNLYDLAPDGTGMLCLQGITGDMVVLSWLVCAGSPLDARSQRHSRPRGASVARQRRRRRRG